MDGEKKSYNLLNCGAVQNDILYHADNCTEADYIDERSLDTHIFGGKGCDGVHVPEPLYFGSCLCLPSFSASGAHSAVCWMSTCAAKICFPVSKASKVIEGLAKSLLTEIAVARPYCDFHCILIGAWITRSVPLSVVSFSKDSEETVNRN